MSTDVRSDTVDRSLIHDLLNHQAWADVEIRKGLARLPQSLGDRRILDKLNHLFQAQKAFLMIACGEELDYSKFREETDHEVLDASVRSLHNEYCEFLKKCTDARLAEVVTIPWFDGSPPQITVLMALAQAAMHSHYHRAQVATRLRELGGEPPLTDLIYWYWKGKPAPDWEKTAGSQG